MIKEQKEVLKDLHKFFSMRFKESAEAFLNDYISYDEIYLYIENEASVAQRINDIREKLYEKELAEKFKTLTSSANDEKRLQELKDTLEVLKLKKKRLANSDAFSPEDVKQRLKSIEENDKWLSYYQNLIDKFELAKNEFNPKRKPGRPKKIKPEVIEIKKSEEVKKDDNKTTKTEESD